MVYSSIYLKVVKGRCAMDQSHRDIIQDKYSELVEALRSDVEGVVKYLYQKRIISRHMEEDISYQRTPTSKVYKLLDLIPTRGPKAFGTLYLATVQQELWEAANILEPSRKSHHPPEESDTSSEQIEEEESLPDVWPNAEHLDDVNLLRLNVLKVESNQLAILEQFNDPNQYVYKMNYKTKGRVVIINNETFTNGLPKREGTEIDSKGLNLLFQGLGFGFEDVEIEPNKTKNEMIQILERECQRDYSVYGCFILFIISHGSEEKVFGTDGIHERVDNSSTHAGAGTYRMDNYLEIASIGKQFSDVSTLVGKPKLFFIQACQGGEHNKGIVPNAPSVSGQESPSADTNNTAHEENLQSVSQALNSKPREGASAAATEDMDVDMSAGDSVRVTASDSGDNVDGPAIDSRVPKYADVLTVCATTAGNASFRNTISGSWFIQAIVYVFAKYAYKDRLVDLLGKVSILVQKARTKDQSMQVTEIKGYTVYKKFYFFPGLSLES